MLLRKQQIAEIIDYDNKINKIVTNRTKQQIELYNRNNDEKINFRAQSDSNTRNRMTKSIDLDISTLNKIINNISLVYKRISSEGHYDSQPVLNALNEIIEYGENLKFYNDIVRIYMDDDASQQTKNEFRSKIVDLLPYYTQITYGIHKLALVYMDDEFIKFTTLIPSYYATTKDKKRTEFRNKIAIMEHYIFRLLKSEAFYNICQKQIIENNYFIITPQIITIEYNNVIMTTSKKHNAGGYLYGDYFKILQDISKLNTPLKSLQLEKESNKIQKKLVQKQATKNVKLLSPDEEEAKREFIFGNGKFGRANIESDDQPLTNAEAFYYNDTKNDNYVNYTPNYSGYAF